MTDEHDGHRAKDHTQSERGSPGKCSTGPPPLAQQHSSDTRSQIDGLEPEQNDPASDMSEILAQEMEDEGASERIAAEHALLAAQASFAETVIAAWNSIGVSSRPDALVTEMRACASGRLGTDAECHESLLQHAGNSLEASSMRVADSVHDKARHARQLEHLGMPAVAAADWAAHASRPLACVLVCYACLAINAAVVTACFLVGVCLSAGCGVQLILVIPRLLCLHCGYS